jgi:hypothetical protein
MNTYGAVGFMSPAAIVILPVVLLLLYYCLSVWQIRNAAKRILGELRKNYTKERNIRVIGPESLPADTAGEYALAKSVVEELGFKFVCYAEDETFTRANGMMVPFQYFKDDKGEVKAATYFLPKAGYTVYDFMTEFSDGRQLITGNAAMAAKINAPPIFIRLHLPAETLPSAILKTHRERLAKILDGSGLACTTAVTPAAILERYRLEHKKIYEFHRDNGWITLKELTGLAPKNAEANARRVYAAIQKILRDEEKAIGRGR